MAPKKAPPPLPPPLIPPPPRVPRLVTLHLYLPSGEFVIEVTQRVQWSIARFVQDLEEGNITPALDLKLGYRHTTVYYLLVWNDVVLREGLNWGNVVVELVMSLIEPNNITVVYVERP